MSVKIKNFSKMIKANQRLSKKEKEKSLRTYKARLKKELRKN
jgi:hypothetical protein